MLLSFRRKSEFRSQADSDIFDASGLFDEKKKLIEEERHKRVDTPPRARAQTDEKKKRKRCSLLKAAPSSLVRVRSLLSLPPRGDRARRRRIIRRTIFIFIRKIIHFIVLAPRKDVSRCLEESSTTNRPRLLLYTENTPLEQILLSI